MSEDDDSAPGWEAIDAALAPIYGDTEPLHYAPKIQMMIGGKDPIDGISLYKSSSFGSHWHIVTYGFSELYAKDWDDPEVSGFGFEFTMRVRRTDDDEVPFWAINFLQNIARYVFSSGNRFAAGHYMNLNSPIIADSDSLIRAIAIAPDAELPPRIETPHGRVDFLQIFGLTLDELDATKRWDTLRFLELARAQIPGLVIDTNRGSLLSDARIAAAIEEGARRDGSSLSVLFPSVASWTTTEDGVLLTFGANGVRDVIAVLPGRLPFGRDLTIYGPKSAIELVPEDSVRWEKIDDATLRLTMPASAASELARTLRVKAGDYQIASLPNVRIRIEQSFIRDQDGNVIETIG